MKISFEAVHFLIVSGKRRKFRGELHA